MSLHDQLEIGKRNRRREMRKFYLTAVIFTIVIFWAEATAGKWLLGLFSVKITMWQSVIAVVTATFLVGLINGMRDYGKNKKSKK